MDARRVTLGELPHYAMLNAQTQALLGQELPPDVEVPEEPVACFRWPGAPAIPGEDEAPPKGTS